MTKQEQKEIDRQLLNIYSGILFNYQQFEEGNDMEIVYNFDCPEFHILKVKYNLEEIAGKGTDFSKAKKILHYLAPRLTHSSWYDNHVPCNALDLLDYSLNNPKQGINCLNKSKILQECCLALGIYARRVSIMPFSPYDFDNHVVTEIYDKKLCKWIMLDPTTDGWFVDDTGKPLSLLEMRDKFATGNFVTFISSTDRIKDLSKIKDKYDGINSYICKNLFYFYVNKDSTFGFNGVNLVFVPKNYSIKENTIENMKYRINNLPEEYKDWIPKLEKKLKELEDCVEDERTNISSMIKAPINP